MVNPLDFFRSAKRVKNDTAETEKTDAESRLRPGEALPDPDAPVFPLAHLDEDDALPMPADVDVQPLGADGIEDTVEVDEPVLELAGGAELSGEDIYRETLKSLQKFFVAAGRLTSAAEQGSLRIDDLERSAKSIVARMEEGDDLMAIAVGPYPSLDRFVLYHSANVAILSQRVARGLQMRPPELEILCLAALLHDIGTVRVPANVFTKSESLSPEEWEVMRKRPVHSRDILQTLGPEYRSIAEIAYQTYERLDGGGYPRQLNVDGVSLEASIIGAVDLFEAIIHPRPYKKTVPAAAMYGVDNMMRMSNQFGDGVLKALVRGVGLFPVGTFVRLNSGEVARVSKSRQGNPMRPTVEVLWDTQKNALKKPKLLDLMQAPHLYVYRPLSTEDLRELGLQV